MTLAAPLINAAGLQASIRARIDLLGANGENLGVLWEGYVRARGVKPSSPGIKVYTGWQVRLVVAASTTLAAATQVNARICVDPDVQPFPGFIFSEPIGPVSGQGDFQASVLANPAVNADYAAVTVGAQSIERLCYFRVAPTVKTLAGGIIVSLTNGADVVTEFVAIIEVGATGTNAIVGSPGPVSKTPSTAITVGASRSPLPLPNEAILQPGWVWQLIRDNPDAADNWNAGTAEVERWAVIL